jgi:hypothetical protein
VGWRAGAGDNGTNGGEDPEKGPSGRQSGDMMGYPNKEEYPVAETPVAETQVKPPQRAFLAAFRKTGNVRLACEAAKVGRSSHYRRLNQDPAYRARN